MGSTIERRRSIRRFTSEPVTDDQVTALMEAAMAAPSASGRDPWHFVVVRDQEVRAQLAKVHQYSGMAANSPVVVAVCGDEKTSAYWVQDCSAATQNLLLRATELGLGAVWVAIHPREDREGRVRELLRVPEGIRVLCLIPVGHPAEEKAPRTRFDPARVHFASF